MTTTTADTRAVGPKPPPPLQHGDHLSRDEFERRWDAQPDLKKAELLNGMVFLASEQGSRRINPKLPPLENGDHLSRDEFRLRLDNMPDIMKAERLRGMVFMPPPVSATNHGVPHSRIMFWLGVYWSATPEVIVGDNSTLWMRSDDDAQPDAMLLILPEHGGQARFDGKGYVEGCPELIAEVAASSADYDLHLKRDVYRNNLVPEYLVWSVHDEEISWFGLRGVEYGRIDPGPDGIVRSEVFPGLWLDAAAMLRGDLATVLRVAQSGTSTPEHASFRKRLAPSRGG